MFKKIQSKERQILTHPKLLNELNCESKNKNIERRRNWGALLSSQHFEDKGAY